MEALAQSGFVSQAERHDAQRTQARAEAQHKLLQSIRNHVRQGEPLPEANSETGTSGRALEPAGPAYSLPQER